MKAMDEAFDAYNLRARILPAVVMILPLWLGLLAWFPIEFKLSGGICIALGALALAFIASDWTRQRGRAIQDDLYGQWGGMPSVLMLSFAHSTINRDTLERCHEKCRQIVPGRAFPDSLSAEAINQSEFFRTYRLCSDLLIERTRDKSKFGVLFEENLRYGMRRNYLGIRRFGLIASLLGAALTAAKVATYWKMTSSIDQMGFIGLIVCIGIFAVWKWFVTEKWVRDQADEYAKRLILSSQNL